MIFYDLGRKSVAKIFSNPLLNSQITGVVSSCQMQFLAAFNQTGEIIFFRLEQNSVKTIIKISPKCASQIEIIDCYQMIGVICYDKTIYIFQIEPGTLELTQKYKLFGHGSIVTSINYIQNTALLTSIDEESQFKIWSLLTQRCIQSIDIKVNQVFQLLSDHHYIYLIGLRIYYVKYDLF